MFHGVTYDQAVIKAVKTVKDGGLIIFSLERLWVTFSGTLLENVCGMTARQLCHF